MNEVRTAILNHLPAMARVFPSWRLCQMVANVGVLAGADTRFELESLSDERFFNALRESIEQRERQLDGQLPPIAEGDTLPALLPTIISGIAEMGMADPQRSFTSLVLLIADRTREFASFDFWDVEDQDVVTAIQGRLAPA